MNTLSLVNRSMSTYLTRSTISDKISPLGKRWTSLAPEPTRSTRIIDSPSRDRCQSQPLALSSPSEWRHHRNLQDWRPGVSKIFNTICGDDFRPPRSSKFPGLGLARLTHSHARYFTAKVWIVRNPSGALHPSLSPPLRLVPLGCYIPTQIVTPGI